MKEYRNAKGRRLEGEGLARRVAEEIKGMMLAMAYMKVKSAGFNLRVARMDGSPASDPKEKVTTRINVAVIDGMVRTTWVG